MASDVPLALAAGTLSDQAPLFLLLLAALVLSTLTSATETALSALNRVRIKRLAEEGQRRPQQIVALLDQPQHYLTAILVMNNVALILASSVATGIAYSLGLPFAELIATAALSVVVVIFCEVIPKNAAMQNADVWAQQLVPFARGATWLLRPLSYLLNAFTRAVLRLAGIPLRRVGPSVTEEDLVLLVNVGEEEGVLQEEERSMITNIFELADTTVREVMVPRIDMVTLAADATVIAAADVINQAGLSRIPVFDTSIDNIIGVLYAKDLLRELRLGHDTRRIRDLVRAAYFVPESKRLDGLLQEMRQRRVHIALISDEYGSVVGLVTIEDLIEEIVGEIHDEYDREDVSYERISPREYLVDAKMNLDDFNELLDIRLEGAEEYDTVGGFVLAKLDKIPGVGDEVRAEEVTLTVVATRGRRVLKVLVVLHRPGESEPEPPFVPPRPAANDLRAAAPPAPEPPAAEPDAPESPPAAEADAPESPAAPEDRLAEPAAARRATHPNRRRRSRPTR